MTGSSRKRRPASGIAPFASIPAAQLATQRLRRLSGDAIRVLLVAHAAWTPKTAAVMPVARIARMLGLSKRSVSAAIRALTGAEFLTLLKPARRPGAMGVATGAAAVFEVAGRRPGTSHRVFETGDRRLDGCVRIYCTDLRRLAAMMTGNEARILAALVLPCARDRHGAPQQPKPLALSGRTTAAALPGVSARAADAAVKGLVGKGLLREVTPTAGRRPATFEPAGLAATWFDEAGAAAPAFRAQAWNYMKAAILRTNRQHRGQIGSVCHATTALCAEPALPRVVCAQNRNQQTNNG